MGTGCVVYAYPAIVIGANWQFRFTVYVPDCQKYSPGSKHHTRNVNVISCWKLQYVASQLQLCNRHTFFALQLLATSGSTAYLFIFILTVHLCGPNQ